MTNDNSLIFEAYSKNKSKSKVKSLPAPSSPGTKSLPPPRKPKPGTKSLPPPRKPKPGTKSLPPPRKPNTETGPGVSRQKCANKTKEELCDLNYALKKKSEANTPEAKTFKAYYNKFLNTCGDLVSKYGCNKDDDEIPDNEAPDDDEIPDDETPDDDEIPDDEIPDDETPDDDEIPDFEPDPTINTPIPLKLCVSNAKEESANGTYTLKSKANRPIYIHDNKVATIDADVWPEPNYWYIHAVGGVPVTYAKDVFDVDYKGPEGRFKAAGYSQTDTNVTVKRGECEQQKPKPTPTPESPAPNTPAGTQPTGNKNKDFDWDKIADWIMNGSKK